jgi:hypothetical protein
VMMDDGDATHILDAGIYACTLYIVYRGYVVYRISGMFMCMIHSV